MKGDYSRPPSPPQRRYDRVLLQQGRVLLDSDWNEQAHLAAEGLRLRGLDLLGRAVAPRRGGGFGIASVEKGRLLIGAGRMYVDGLLCALDAACAYDEQPWLPDAPELAPVAGRRDLVYLDAWERAASAAEAPEIREPALGGADTTARVEVVAQVRVLRGFGDDAPGRSAAWSEATAPSAGTLTTLLWDRVAAHGYEGGENRLYRVEVHDPGDLGQATFKWSRDNGATAFAIELIGPDAVTIPLGAGPVALEPNDWIELLDERLDLHGLPGHVAQVTVFEPGDGRVAFEPSLPEGLLRADRRPRLRRWDAAPGGRAVRATSETSLDLEDGLRVRFGSGRLRAGDHWLFEVRGEAGTLTPLVDARPHGIARHRAPLALVEWGEGGAVAHVEDLRIRAGALGERALPRDAITVGDGLVSAGDFLDVHEAVAALDGPGRVLLRDGIHVLSGSLRVPSGVTLAAESGTATLRAPPAGPALVLEGDRPALVGLRVVGAGEGPAILVEGARDALVRMCEVARGAGRVALRAVGGRGLRIEDARFAAPVELGGGIRDARVERSRFAPAHGPALRLEDARGVQVGGNHLEAAPGEPALLCARVEDLRIEENEAVAQGAPAFALQGSGLDVRGNRLRGGGLLLGHGTLDARARDNDIADGADAGIALGGAHPAWEGASRDGVRDALVQGNRVARMASGGVRSIDPGDGGEPHARLRILDNALQDCGDAAHPALRVAHADDFEARGNAIDGSASPHGIVATRCRRLSVEGNAVRGAGLAVMARDAFVRRNEVRGGAMRILGGSAQVLVEGNLVLRSPGAAIEVGSALDGHSPAGGLADVAIVGNVAREAEGPGILLGRLGSHAPATGIRVEDNEVAACSCAGDPSAGIALREVTLSRVARNRVTGNGAGARACGILVDLAEGVEVRGNLVTGNGGGRAGGGWQAGIVVLDALRGAGGHAVVVEGNLVRAPAGPALVVTGVGAMAIQGNHLATAAPDAQAEERDQGACCVFVKNAGQPLDGPEGHASGSPLARAGGRVAVEGNEVELRAHDAPPAAACSALLSSDDDLLVAGNRFTTLVAAGRLFADVLADASTMRIVGNRFVEGLVPPAFSCYARASRANVCADNQSTAPLRNEGPGALVERDNQRVAGR